MGRRRSGGTLRKILFARRQPRPPVIRARTCAIVITDDLTGTAHLVTDEAFAAGRRTAGGRYLAVCGAQVFAASLAAPARSHCPACERGSASTRTGGGTHADR